MPVFPLSALFAAALLLASPSALAAEIKAPNAAQIEQALRDKLNVPAANQPQLRDFKLLELHRIGPRQWDAKAELQLNYGAPPAGVVGFQRRLQAPYWIRLSPTRNGWRILRFNPAGGVHNRARRI